MFDILSDSLYLLLTKKAERTNILNQRIKILYCQSIILFLIIGAALAFASTSSLQVNSTYNLLYGKTVDDNKNRLPDNL